MWPFKKTNDVGNLRRKFHHILLEQRKLKSPTGLFHKGMPSTLRRAHKRQKPAWLIALQKIGVALCFIAILAGIFYMVVFSNYFVVTEVSVEKHGDSIPVTALAPYINRLKNRNIIFLQTDVLINDIEKTFLNEVLVVQIKKNFPHSITLSVDEYPPELNLKIIEGSSARFLVVNQAGYSISDKPVDLVPTLLIRDPKEPEHYKIKAIIFEKTFLQKISAAFKKFYDLFDMGVEFGEWNTRARELHLKTEKGFMVWLDLMQDVDPQLLKLKRSLAKLDIYNEPLDYIDLRISSSENEKVIFKRRN